MSQLYNLEPNPTAKVILKTTSGDLLLELFAKQTPVTSRNFLQLCLDGYYDNTIFHRLVPDFIVQGGDPTGTGSGGQSSHDGGLPFQDELHSRLRFNRRGLLGMANSGAKNDNGSQFFFTLGKAEELNGRNTMFGRIEGDTIYNLVRIGESELADGEGSDRPMYPTRVTSSEILVNPFEDMIQKVQVTQARDKGKTVAKKKSKKKPGKQMLSFDDEDGDGDRDAGPMRQVPKFNPKLVQADDALAKPIRTSTSTNKDRSSTSKPTTVEERGASLNSSVAPGANPPLEDPSSESEPDADVQAKKLATTNARIAELKQSLKRDVSHPSQHDTKRQKTSNETMMPVGARRGVTRPKPGSKEEQKQLQAFTAFQALLSGGTDPKSTPETEATRKSSSGVEKSQQPTSTPSGPDEEDVCDLHFVPDCQSCKRWEEAEQERSDDDLGSESLLGHTLTFAKDRLGKSLEWKRQNETELVVIDPREREKELLGHRKRSNKVDRS